MKKSILLLFAFLLTNSAFAQSNCNVDVINSLNQKSTAIDNVIMKSLSEKGFIQSTRDSSGSVLEVSEIDAQFAFSTVIVSVKLKNLRNEHREITTTGAASANIFLAAINSDNEKSRVTKAATAKAMENLSKLIRSKCK